MSRTDGGYDTARITASEQDRIHREQREADARRYLLARDLNDIAEILGLIDSPPPKRQPRNRIPKSRKES